MCLLIQCVMLLILLKPQVCVIIKSMAFEPLVTTVLLPTLSHSTVKLPKKETPLSGLRHSRNNVYNC